MRAWSFCTLSLSGIAVSCSPTGTAPATPADITLRTDTTAVAYLGPPMTAADSGVYGIVIDPLIDVGEPPLRGARLQPNQRVMRFTWVRSFHPTVIVRVIDQRTRCRIVTTTAHPHMLLVPELLPADSAPPATAPVLKERPAQVIRRDSVDVTPSVCAALASSVARAELLPKAAAQMGGLDGSEWLLDQADAQGHTARMNWSPDAKRDRSLYEAGVAFLRAAQAMPTRAHEMY